MLRKLHESGVTSEMMFTAGAISIGASFLSWLVSERKEKANLDRADRWGIFVGEWAPTFFALGTALRLEEESSQRGMAKLRNKMNT
ncbi:hypothetical protein DFQ14_104111 [Halopolyspora algeriensis]|uniref:Uncharacterized protein n=1 Tax=Halopolyspora algeriensis TaxID=1500506 RepID=A0A368VRG1_9ACTN|nr:hypothetical protein [Halopolyspora algeriensis]RCW44522.1 hypothetical protein DFQ14_104111 [Halopolyspora algeriensis]TQM55882.1 hypothetical protein FHU43_0660 [Halopolyspora algeriensis]